MAPEAAKSGLDTAVEATSGAGAPVEQRTGRAVAECDAGQSEKRQTPDSSAESTGSPAAV